MEKFQLILKIATAKPLIIKAIKIAFVVGIILNLINQGNVILALNFEQISWFKLLLTFTVPFCVSMYTAISMKLKFHVGEKSIDDLTLRCKECNSCISLKQNQIIPFCKSCEDKTQWTLTSKKDKKCQQHKLVQES